MFCLYIKPQKDFHKVIQFTEVCSNTNLYRLWGTLNNLELFINVELFESNMC